MSTTLLDVNGLEISFGTEAVVKGISFSVHTGETVALVGESGSGKSMTALSLMQLLPEKGRISAGTIRWKPSEVNLAALRSGEIRKYRGKNIAMIFQEPMTSLNPVFTCGYQVAEAVSVHRKLSAKEIRKKVLEVFEKVKLPDPARIYKSYPHQLSGGQKQRVMIAMAIINEPDLLIADEPTTALDVTVQKRILELLKSIQKETGMGMLFITHDLGVVRDLADSVLVMLKGEIVEKGSVQQLFTEPEHPYTKGLLACRPPLDYRVSKLPVVNDFLQDVTLTVSGVRTKFEVSPETRRLAHTRLFAEKPLLQVKDLSKIYASGGSWWKKKSAVHAVDSISFEVYPGETLGLVGESGCGKTTLGRTVLRLIEPTKGQVFFEGKEVTAMGASELRKLRKHMQIVFQDPYSSLNPRFTIGETIEEPIRVHDLYSTRKEARKRVIELLERVGLNESHYNRFPHEFSGGQRQRVAIARALGLNPKFIVCDESVSALDVSIQAQVLNLLNELKRDFGFTYIFISHDLSVVKFMSDRMLVMNRGKLVEIGEADQVYTSPQSDYTRQLIAAIPGNQRFI